MPHKPGQEVQGTAHHILQPFSHWLSSAFPDVASAHHLLRQKVIKPQGHGQCLPPWRCSSLWSLAEDPFHLKSKISEQSLFLLHPLSKPQATRKETKSRGRFARNHCRLGIECQSSGLNSARLHSFVCVVYCLHLKLFFSPQENKNLRGGKDLRDLVLQLS